MWRVILVTVVVIAVLIGWSIACIAFGMSVGKDTVEEVLKAQGGLPLKGVGLLKKARGILDDLVYPKGLEPPMYMLPETRKMIEQWLSDYQKAKVK